MIRERRECDVFGTTKDVNQIAVVLLVGSTEDTPETQPAGSGDLSPRAVKRLLRFIKRGLAKPGTEID